MSLPHNRKVVHQGFTLVELLMGILLTVLLVSLSRPLFFNSMGKYRVDQAVYMTQSIFFAAQNYFLENNKWPGSNRNRAGDTANEKCADGYNDIINGGYLGGVVAPGSAPTLQALTNALGNDMIIRCANVAGDLTKDLFWIRQCVPEGWVGYFVNALPNSRRHIPSVNNRVLPLSYLNCDLGDSMIETRVPAPGGEPYVAGFTNVTGSAVTKHSCPDGLNADILVAPPRVCKIFSASGNPQPGDEKDLAGMSFNLADEGTQWRLNQYFYRTVAEVDNTVLESVVYKWSDGPQWSDGLPDAGQCGGALDNRFWAWRICQ
ncbi:MAG: hypothetical protein JKY67_06045 [Pseudomonadales bacterium]|nr:hypothetical protein [Pseudomonadales bacterium]